MMALIRISCIALVLICADAIAQDTNPVAGLVVESIVPSSLGIETGDVLLAWHTADANAARPAFQHPLDIVNLRHLSIGGVAVTLTIDRNGEAQSVVLPAGEWEIHTRPGSDAQHWSDYEEGVRLIAAGEQDEGIAILENIAADVDAFEHPHLRAAFLETLARRYRALWRTEDEAAAWERALAIRRSVSAESFGIARDLQGLGDAALRQRDLDAAIEYYDQALAMRDGLAPDSLATALSRQRLAFVALQRRDLPTMEQHIEAALGVSGRTPPQGLIHAETLRAQGVIFSIKGDAEAARQIWLEALAIYREWAPGSVGESRVLSNIGIAVWQMGDLVAAERYFRQALDIVERLAPGSPPHGGYLNNLGLIYHARFEFDRARVVYERATELFESRAPDSLEVARSLTNVALAYGLGGRPGEALERLERVLEIQERLQPGSPDIAQTWHGIGLNQDRAGDLEAAEAALRTALDMREDLLPESYAVGSSAHTLGTVLTTLGQDSEAEILHTKALNLFARLAPGTTAEAQALHALGEIYRNRGETDKALAHLRNAIDAIERQTSRLGGSEEAQGSFSARFANYYKDYIELLLQQGQNEEAFHYLERYRARMLREMLAERDINLGADLPENLRERRQDTNQRYERAMDQLRRLSNTEADAGMVDSILEELADVQAEREAIAAEVRDTAPRLASAVYTQSVRADAAAAALADEDSILLSYCVTSEATYLFVIRNGAPLEVVTIQAGQEQLAADLESLLFLIQVPDAGPDVNAGLTRKSQALYELLLASVLEGVSPETHLVIIPDGALHGLPFAALVIATDDQESPSYLIERHPIRTTLSATLYTTEVSRPAIGDTPPQTVFAAFGDPVFESTIVGTNLESAPGRGRGRELGPLPLTRVEVETIAELFPGDASTYLGADATEDAVKTIAPHARYLHIASHGVLDSRFPLDSYLALARPEDPDTADENGLLHAWEILEQLELNSDLVVLSACESALGHESGGEGLLGLSWAFRYAGARSVLASLWPVSDRSTSELMTRFYVNVNSGMERDEALRAAQLALLAYDDDVGVFETILGWFRSDGRAPSSNAHPYHWAAFQLAGAGN